MDATSPAAAEERPPLSQAEIAADLDLHQLRLRLLRFAGRHYRARCVPAPAVTRTRSERIELLRGRHDRGEELFHREDVIGLEWP
jgi:hypothetical protein